LPSAINDLTSSSVNGGAFASTVGATGAAFAGVAVADAVDGVDELSVSGAGDDSTDDEPEPAATGADDDAVNGAGVANIGGSGELVVAPLPLPASENGTGDDSVNGVLLRTISRQYICQLAQPTRNYRIDFTWCSSN
jgi:hypothetical protein